MSFMIFARQIIATQATQATSSWAVGATKIIGPKMTAKLEAALKKNPDTISTWLKQYQKFDSIQAKFALASILRLQTATHFTQRQARSYWQKSISPAIASAAKISSEHIYVVNAANLLQKVFATADSFNANYAAFTKDSLKASKIGRYTNRNSLRTETSSPFFSSFEHLTAPFFNNIIRGIIVINILVFCLWMYANSGGNYGLGRFMVNNFTSSLSNSVERSWTLFTSAFSHKDLFHLLINMFVFNSFAPSVLAVTGKYMFLNLYLGLALVSSLTGLFYHSYTKPNTRINSLGASGVVSGAIQINSGMFVITALLRPAAPVYLIFIPMQMWHAAALYLGYDFWQTIQKTNGTIDTAAHLGGALGGFLFWKFVLRGMRL